MKAHSKKVHDKETTLRAKHVRKVHGGLLDQYGTLRDPSLGGKEVIPARRI